MLQLLFPIFILIGSLLLLAVSSGIAIKAVEKIIEFTGLSEVSAGFIILAVLTSVPEMLVALFAGLQGVSGISIGNILGSNIFNIGGVLGVLGVFGTLKLCCTNLFLDLSDILFITSAIPLILVIFGILSPIIGGLLFVSFFGTNIYLSRKRTPVVKTSPPTTPVLPMIDGEACVLETKDQETNKKNKFKTISITILLLVVSLIGLIFSAELVVNSGLDIAVALGAPPILIGAKIIALGTSLPELATSIQAARIGRVQLAIGNVLGSNLSNITLILGLTLITTPFTVDLTVFTEILPFLLISTIVFWRFLARGGITRVGGAILLATYIVFLVLI